jgi:hypothetical protein
LGLLVIFRNLPPDAGGAATIIRNLFEFSDESVTILGRKSRYSQEISSHKYKKVEIPLSDKSENIFFKFKFFFQSILIGLKVIKQTNKQNILGIYRDESTLILSYILSILSNKPLFVYFTDLYAENYDSRIKQYFQRIIFKRAKCIFCLNEAMKLHYLAIGYKKVEVIPSTIPEIYPINTKVNDGKVFKIAFSGSIIYDRLDLLQMMVKIIGNNSKYELIFFSPNDDTFLKLNKLYANNVTCEFVNNTKLLVEKLQQCDLLYLPLTFNKPNDQRSFLQLKTCLGTKSYEYMQTGVPILVHSPSEYYTYQYFKINNSAFLLDNPNKDELYELLEKFRNKLIEPHKVVNQAHLQLVSHLSKPNFQKLMDLISYFRAN